MHKLLIILNAKVALRGAMLRDKQPWRETTVAA